MIYSTMINRVMIGLFPYWLGVKYRRGSRYSVIDLGYLKLMVMKRK